MYTYVCVHSKVLPRRMVTSWIPTSKGRTGFYFFLFSPSPFSVRLDSRLTGMIAFSWTRMGSFLVAARDPPSRNNRKGKERPPWKEKKKKGMFAGATDFSVTAADTRRGRETKRGSERVTRRLRGPRIVVDTRSDPTNRSMLLYPFNSLFYFFPSYFQDRSSSILNFILYN